MSGVTRRLDLVIEEISSILIAHSPNIVDNPSSSLPDLKSNLDHSRPDTQYQF
jgi:hypothetical protein